jgi:hypothetical protein
MSNYRRNTLIGWLCFGILGLLIGCVLSTAGAAISLHDRAQVRSQTTVPASQVTMTPTPRPTEAGFLLPLGTQAAPAPAVPGVGVGRIKGRLPLGWDARYSSLISFKML